MKTSSTVMVSVLIVAYNAARFIPKALASVAKQSMTDWELIVIEDGSNDGTETIVAKFAGEHSIHRVVFQQLRDNLGVAAARNHALTQSEGKFVAFLDADDHWMPHHLNDLLKKLGDGHVLACSPISIWDGNSDRELCVYKPSPAEINRPQRGLFLKSFIQTCSCVAMPRETIERVGMFDESFRIGEDRDFWFRAVEGGGSIGCTTLPTCCYLKHGRSSMAKTLLVAEQTVKFYEKHMMCSCVSVWIARLCLSQALRTQGRLCRARNSNMARQAFLRAWKIWPLGVDLPFRALFCW